MGITQQIGASSLIKPGVIDNTAARPASPFEGQVIYQKDTDIVSVYNGAAWIGVGYPMAIFNELQASGTNGGSATSGSYTKRTLNTTIKNDIVGCTLTSSVISLPAGTYFVSAFAPTYNTERSKLRLQNTTDATTINVGQNCFASANQNSAVLQTVFTITGTKNIELQHRFQTTVNTNGLGVPCSFGDDECYSTIQIVRMAG
jgi:hypothetical protein